MDGKFGLKRLVLNRKTIVSLIFLSFLHLLLYLFFNHFTVELHAELKRQNGPSMSRLTVLKNINQYVKRVLYPQFLTLVK